MPEESEGAEDAEWGRGAGNVPSSPTACLVEETTSGSVGSGTEMTVGMSNDKSGKTEKESDDMGKRWNLALTTD